MSGELRAEPRGYTPQRHDHLVLFTARRALVFTVRGCLAAFPIRCRAGLPACGRKSPRRSSPTPSRSARSRASCAAGGRAPIKAVLLMQERFPGIGNWMADEVLWRAAIHPRQPAGSLRSRRCARSGARAAGSAGSRSTRLPAAADYLPPDLNAHIRAPGSSAIAGGGRDRSQDQSTAPARGNRRPHDVLVARPPKAPLIMPPPKLRLDELLVARGLADSGRRPRP